MDPYHGIPQPRRRTGTRDFALDAADSLTQSRTPFCLLVVEPNSPKTNIMTTFTTKRQCINAIHAIEVFMGDSFGPDWAEIPD